MELDESILNSIKLQLGIATDYEYFDQQIVMEINTALAVTNQLGIGPPEGFAISGPEQTWKDFIGTDATALLVNSVKTYVYFRVKLSFDPPSSSSVTDSFERQMREIEWRLTITDYTFVQPEKPEDPVDPDDPEDYYDGPYAITPQVNPQEIDCDNRIMRDDVDILAIPYQEVSNETGGKTSVIG